MICASMRDCGSCQQRKEEREKDIHFWHPFKKNTATPWMRIANRKSAVNSRPTPARKRRVSRWLDSPSGVALKDRQERHDGRPPVIVTTAAMKVMNGRIVS